MGQYDYIDHWQDERIVILTNIPKKIPETFYATLPAERFLLLMVLN